MFLSEVKSVSVTVTLNYVLAESWRKIFSQVCSHTLIEAPLYCIQDRYKYES